MKPDQNLKYNIIINGTYETGCKSYWEAAKSYKKGESAQTKRVQFLPINTNQQYKDDDQHLENDIEVFDETIKDILNNIDQYIRLPETDHWDDDKIKDVNIDYAVERGMKKGQIHAHIMIKIKHFSKVLLNYEKLKSKLCEDLGLENVYMNNKLIRNSGSDNILDYLDKYV